MFIHNISPDLLHIGPLAIRFYGIVYALGFLLVTYVLSKYAETGKIKNLTKDKASDVVIYALLGGLIGARIFHVLSDFHLYQNNLLGMFAIWNGGLGFQGGFIGALITLYWYCKKHNIKLMPTLDIVVIPIPLILGFGRIANFLNSEHLGHISNVPWCVVYQQIGETVCRHPAQLYQSLSQFLLFFALFFLYKTKWGKKTGNMFFSFVTGYGIVRFTTDFWRAGHSLYFFSLSHTQVLSIAMILVGGYFLMKKRKKK